MIPPEEVTIHGEHLRRHKLAERDGWYCQACGREVVCPTCAKVSPNSYNSATLEHRIPRSAGGTDAMDNLCLYCSPCNNLKGDLIFFGPGMITKDLLLTVRNLLVIQRRRLNYRWNCVSDDQKHRNRRARPQAYLSEEHANTTVEILKAKFGRNLKPYECKPQPEGCGMWHLSEMGNVGLHQD